MLSFVAAFLALCVGVHAGPLVADQLRVNHLASSDIAVLAIDTNPSFSWQIQHTDRAQVQSGYRIRVATDVDMNNLVWDSGLVSSSDSQLIAYAGSALTADTTYYWNVQWQDSSSNLSPVSEVSQFDIALINGWGNSTWIAAADNENVFQAIFYPRAGNIVRARAYVAGLGFHIVTFNGTKVGSEILAPGWTQWTKRVLYLSYDVTHLVQGGDPTVVQVYLGVGWRNSTLFPNNDHNTPPSDNHEMCLRVIVTVTYDDGTTETVLQSSETWQALNGPVIQSSIYNGVTYDARKILSHKTFQAHAFSQPIVVSGPAGVLSVQSMEGIQLDSTVEPVGVTSPQNGMYIVNFGQNFAGVCQLTVNNCPSGTVITLRHAEILNDNGDGYIYTANLRSAQATDIYICAGDNTEVFVPPFTYHGFQYVEVTGFPGQFQMSNIQALHFHSAAKSRGYAIFEDGESILSNLFHNVYWGHRSNLMSVPTDCDQRDERLGWMGDASLSSEAIGLNFQVGAFFNHYVQLIADEQFDDGSIPDVVPFQRYGNRPADPSWSSAYPQLIYTLYKYYGDEQVVAANMNGMMSYIKYVTQRVQASGMGNFYFSYGDWIPPTPEVRCNSSLLSATSYLHNILQIGTLAHAIGEDAIEAQMLELFTEMNAKFNAAFFNSETNIYDTGLQTAQSFPLLLSLVPEQYARRLTYYLINDIVTTHNSHVTTGISGFKSLWQVLSKIGRSDLALEIALILDYPSIGWMMVNPQEPASTVWELWDAPKEDGSMNSRNHHMFSSIGQAFWETFVGISQPDPDAGSVGYEFVNLRPFNGVGISSASGTLSTSRGPVMLFWERHSGMQCQKVSEGMSATISCGDSTITSIDVASYGTPVGVCGSFGVDDSCHASASTTAIEAICLHQSSCVVPANSTFFNEDPCPNTKKWFAVQVTCAAPASWHVVANVPVGSTAELQIPILSMDNMTLTETTGVTFQNGQFVPQKESGIVGAYHNSNDNTLAVQVGSGTYTFRMTGEEALHVCAQTLESLNMTLTCPPQYVINHIAFASYGNPPRACNTQNAYTRCPCHAGSSKAVFEDNCLGLNSCEVFISNSVFEVDPCVNVHKWAVVDVTCLYFGNN